VLGEDMDFGLAEVSGGIEGLRWRFSMAIVSGSQRRSRPMPMALR
jgi:hypothetical protein